MIIDKVFKLLNQVSSKSTSGGYISPDEYNNYCYLVQNQKIDFELSKKADTTFSNEMNKDYRKSVSLLVSNKGRVEYPEDYRYFNSASYFNSKTFATAAFEELSSDEWYYRLGSHLDRPTEEFPACNIKKDYLEVAPNTLSIVNLEYIFTPPAPIYGTTVINNRRVFDESSSTDFVFGEEDVPDLVYRLATLMGLEIRDSELYQISKTEEAETK